MWTILIFIVIGMVAGWAASLLIRREKYPTDWGVLFIIGILGSLIAGILINLIMGDGFKVRPGRHHRLHRRGLRPAVALHAGAEPGPGEAAGAADDHVERPAPRAQGRQEAPQQALAGRPGRRR